MNKNFNPERLLQVLVAPQISEKATYIADKNEQVVFIVTPDATKPEVKAAVEMLFKVQVESVQIANLKGKIKRSGRTVGRRSDISGGGGHAMASLRGRTVRSGGDASTC